ncbi:apiosidase-like domain-containing protein [Novipirellula artificiosorum]|uniref:Putative endoglucanase n=1 Tax=Novipirellula artificiosorum TaxID=2528016 RepID=A0A5C6DAF4_9BACT|nr:DUF4038 domain-containing protein [Novipirellula artificiosorum]TWU31819.1 putative endoglucanase [Novipirellula artificiosorum]
MISSTNERRLDSRLSYRSFRFIAQPLITVALASVSVMAAEPITKWTPVVMQFDSEESYPWWEFPVEATLRHEGSGAQLQIEAFYDGPKRYTLRFALPLAGKWSYRIKSRDSKLNGNSGVVTVEAPTQQQSRSNPNLRGHVRASENGRYFQYADGKPFFFLGDTNWSINTARCGLGANQDGPFFEYLNDRKSKGFAAILVAYMRGFGDTDEPAGQRNEGGYPFTGGQVEQLNAKYFQSLDTRMQAIWDRGFVVAVHPTWFAKRNCFFDHESAKRISAYLAVRYGAYNGLWSLSGEYQYTMKDCSWTESQLNELGEVVQQHNPYHHPLSIHPSGNPKWAAPHGDLSSRAFHDAVWHDHNWLQTGQKLPMLCNVALRAIENYKLSPTKPVILSEGYYERYTDPEHVYHSRWQAWTAFLNGSAGYGYGAFGVWQFYTPDDAKGETGKKTDGHLFWKEAMAMEGSRQMRPVRELLSSLPWWQLTPSRNLIVVNGKRNPPPTPDDITPPHCGKIADAAMVVYIPRGNADNELRIDNLPSQDFAAHWFDPRTAARTMISDSKQLANGVIPPRPESADEDWVLLLLNTNSDENRR